MNTNGKVSIVTNAYITSGLERINETSSENDKATAFGEFIEMVLGFPELEKGLAKDLFIKKLKVLKFAEPGKYANTLLNTEKPKQLAETIAPYEGEVDGEKTFLAIKEALNRFLMLPAEADTAITLWIMFAWVHDAFEFSPPLNVWSPTMRCGKTRLLKVLKRLVPKPMPTCNISPSALFRVVERDKPTLLVDEADSFLKGQGSEDLRGIINAGFENGGLVIRNVTVGDEIVPTQFRTWCPKVLAGIGRRSATIRDRSLSIHMKRMPRQRKVQRFWRGVHDEMDFLNSMLQKWANDNGDALDEIYNTRLPECPEGMNDRARDVWEVLLTIADYIGGQAPDVARKSAMTISGGEDDSESIQVELLETVLQVFGDSDWVEATGKDICEKLCQIEDAPWGEINNGKPISATKLARMLKPFGIRSTNKRPADQSGQNRRFYQIAEIESAYKPYRPDPEGSVTSVTGLKSKELRGKEVLETEANVTPLTRDKSNENKDVTDVTLCDGGIPPF